MQGPDRIARLNLPALVVHEARDVATSLKIAAGIDRNERTGQIAVHGHGSAGVDGNRFASHFAIHGERSAIVHSGNRTIQFSLHGQRAAVDVCDRTHTTVGHRKIARTRFDKGAVASAAAQKSAVSPIEALIEDNPTVVDDIALQAVRGSLQRPKENKCAA